VTSRESIPVRHAVHDELPAVAAVLSRAFFTDRIYCWMVPDDAQRRRSADVFYARFVDACWAHNEVQIAGTGIGAALWIPPGMPLVSDEDAEAFSRGLFESAGDAASSARMERVMTVVDQYHPAEPCWYLAFMGVDPAAQGQGIGSAMLTAVLERADRDGVPAYLEASCPENQRLYERHGFVTMGELNVSDCPAIYPMWRPPTG
jgi:GNAT superfamily N-acetyltransferase